MSGRTSITITLPAETVELIEERLATGAYADEADVVRDGLQALADRDNSLERWLQADVLPAYREMRTHPDKAISIDEARDRLHAHITQRLADPKP